MKNFKLMACLLACAAIFGYTAVGQSIPFDGQLDTFEFAKPGGHSLSLDLYRPNAWEGDLPLVVFVHGGGWKNGSKASGGKHAAWLTEHGFAVASIQYRLTDAAQWPAQIDDCYAAVRWLRSHATELRLDSENVGAWGTSAGAHLAALMGTRLYPKSEPVSSRVSAVCDWFGPSDLLTMPPNNVGDGRTAEDVARSNGAKLLGATVREVPELAKDASAYYQVSRGDASFLIMHGDEDTGVPLAQSERLHERLLEAGVASEFRVVEGAGHGGPLFAAPESRQAVLRFFEKTLKSSD